MCTYYRSLKDGSEQEFIFEKDRNKYNLVNINGIMFNFTLEQRFIHFDIDTHNLENQGYGTALLSIVFEYATQKHFDFVCGYLSTADYYNNNWEISIPFYLHKNQNSFLIKESKRMRNIYPQFSNFQEWSNQYTHYLAYNSFTQNISDGYIIYPIQHIKRNDWGGTYGKADSVVSRAYG